jgi:putative membrane protein
MAVAANIIYLYMPIGAFLWAAPSAWRRALGDMAQVHPVAALWRGISHPLAATTLHGVALWAWHMPAFYDRVLVSAGMHWLQHMSFLLTALLFWWSLVYGRARRRGYGAAVFYLFVTALHTGVLGILLTVSRHLWYPRQAAFAAEWGLTPLEDQQLAGLVMWVPAGLVYAVAALALAGLWISRSGSGAIRGDAHAAA